MDDFQFYPTPPDLARRAWKKFKNKDFERVLEPEAGNGDLAVRNPISQGTQHVAGVMRGKDMSKIGASASTGWIRTAAHVVAVICKQLPEGNLPLGGFSGCI